MNETRFHGGLTIRPLVQVGWDASDFATNGISAFANSLRGIRNGLAHGGEPKTNAVITPTTENFHRLQPWASIISVVAAEVMVYRGIE